MRPYMKGVLLQSSSEYQPADGHQTIIPPPVPLLYLHLLNPSSFISVRPMRELVVYHVREKSYLGGVVVEEFIAKAERSPEEEPITTVRVD